MADPAIGTRRADRWLPGRNGRRGVALALVLGATTALAACDLLPAKSPGERLWRQRCGECHGRDGAGNTPRFMGNYRADLLDETWEHGSDPGSWAVVIREGVFGQMPANEELTQAEVDALVEHLRELRRQSSGTRG